MRVIVWRFILRGVSLLGCGSGVVRCHHRGFLRSHRPGVRLVHQSAHKHLMCLKSVLVLTVDEFDSRSLRACTGHFGQEESSAHRVSACGCILTSSRRSWTYSSRRVIAHVLPWCFFSPPLAAFAHHSHASPVWQAFVGGRVSYAYTCIPTYPCGQIGFVLCSKPGADMADFDAPVRPPPGAT